MDNLFRNSEYKDIMKKLLLAQILFSIILFLGLHMSFRHLNKGLVEQNAAIIGKLAKIFPDDIDMIVTSFLSSTSNEHIEVGRALLEKYSYKDNIHMALQPILGQLYLKIELIITFIAFSFILPLMIIIHRGYSLIYKKIRYASYAAERVVQDDFSHTLPEDDGGDFAILSHNFNQMANRIKLSLKALQDDKLFLKDTIS
ncbi:MAG: hypothetical protein GX974_10150, partial [Clostridiales bacterium]|nr:hypothetical protein [Clostridiales bacterium]